MAADNIYEIILNEKCDEGSLISDNVRFGHRSYELYADRGKAMFRFQMNTKQTATEFLLGREGEGRRIVSSNNVYLIRDMFRKAILLHAIKYNSGLQIRKIIFTVNGEREELSKDNNPIRDESSKENFPYVFSMIQDVADLGLDPSWENLADVICGTTKSYVSKNLCFSSMYSYLASKSKFYFVDRFTCLWTSMNAYYSFITECYEESVRKEIAAEVKKMPEYGGEEIKLKKGPDFSSEAAEIGLAAWMTYPKGTEPRYTDFSDIMKRPGLWEYKEETEGSPRNTIRTRVEKCLKRINSEESAARLYKAALADLRGETMTVVKGWEEILKVAAELSGIAERVFNVKLFIFLLYIYPYDKRCNLFHGDGATLLISMFKDPELAHLNVINYFLDRFLNQEIPRIFEKNYWSEEKHERAKSFYEKWKKDQLKEKDKDKAAKFAYSAHISSCARSYIDTRSNEKGK